jgi:hypothetical protein
LVQSRQRQKFLHCEKILSSSSTTDVKYQKYNIILRDPEIVKSRFSAMSFYRSSEGGYTPAWGQPSSTLKYTKLTL